MLDSMIPDDPYGEMQMLLADLPDSASTIVAKAKEFRASGDVDFALELLDRALGKDRAPILLIAKADALLREKNVEAALELVLESIGLDPTNRWGRDVLRRALLAGLPDTRGVLLRFAVGIAKDDAEFAETLLLAALEREPEDLAIREQVARLYADQQRIVDCIGELDEILARDPDHAEAMLMLAAAMIHQGDLPRGQKLLNRARRRGVSAQLADELEARIQEFVTVISRSKGS